MFDCDSTLSAVEGIDWLALRQGQGVNELTDAAMAGQVDLERVYAERLEQVAPSRALLEELADEYLERAVPKAWETVSILAELGKEVWIVSGGLRPAVLSVGKWLGVPEDRVRAVDVYFEPSGEYRDFERTSLLTRQEGKAELVRGLLTKRTAFVGDGMTDAATRDVVECFVCFAGVIRREPVAAVADHTIEVRSLAAVLPLLLTGPELTAVGLDGPWASSTPRSQP